MGDCSQARSMRPESGILKGSHWAYVDFDTLAEVVVGMVPVRREAGQPVLHPDSQDQS